MGFFACKRGLFILGMWLLVMTTGLAAVAQDKPAGGSEKKPATEAAWGQGWYLGGSIGGAFPGGLSNQPFTVGQGPATVNVNQGYNLSGGWSVAGQAGYQFEQDFRVEGEFLYQSFGRGNTTLQATGVAGGPINLTCGGSGLNTSSVFLNGYYDFRGRSKFAPFLGAGVGMTWLDAASGSGGAGVLVAPGLKQSVFGYQAKAGLSYNATASTDLFLQYRYTGTAGFNYGGATTNLGGVIYTTPQRSGSLSNHAIEFGVRIRP